MKQSLFILFVAVLTTFSLTMPEAEAKRFGGRSSFGMQRQASPPAQAPRQAATPPQPRPAAAQGAQSRSSWMGPIAGLATGLGLAALFSHLGLSEEFGSLMLMLLMAGAALFLFRRLLHRPGAREGHLQYAAGTAALQPASFDAGRPVNAGTSAAFGTQETVSASSALPADFDAEGFARQAKVQFIRLQAAHDAANLDEIREFTTPEVFGEIRLQLAERGAAEQRTDVIELNAEVVELAEEDKRWVVSVRFNGLLREEAGVVPAPFDEIWHLTKAKDGNAGWVIAGIQQVS